MLANYWGTPEKLRMAKWGEPAAVAQTIGVSVATVRKARSDKRVRKMIEDALDEQLLYDLIEVRRIEMEIARDESEKSDTRLKACRTMEQIAGKLQGNGPTVNITNDYSTYEGVPTAQLRQQARDLLGPG